MDDTRVIVATADLPRFDPILQRVSDIAEDLAYRGAASPLQSVWLALRANVRQVLESVTLADLVRGELPGPVLQLSEHPDVWSPR